MQNSGNLSNISFQDFYSDGALSSTFYQYFGKFTCHLFKPREDSGWSKVCAYVRFAFLQQHQLNIKYLTSAICNLLEDKRGRPIIIK